MASSSRPVSRLKILLQDLTSLSAVPGAADARELLADPHQRERVVSEQLELFHRNIPAGTTGSLIGAIVVASLLWGQAPQQRLLVWAAFMASVIALEFFCYVRLVDMRVAGRIGAHDMRATVSAFGLEGLGWALSTFFLLPTDLAYQALLLMMIMIIATFGAIYLSMFLPALYAFETPLLLLVAAAMFSQGTFVHNLLGFAMLVSLGAMLVYSRNSNQTLAAAIAANLKARGLVDELVVQKDAAEKANVAKTRFLASASHDLRQPMHTIGLLVDILRDRVSRSEDRLLVERIHGAVLAMENLFKGLLDISKLDAGAVEPNVSAFALSELFDIIKLSFASQAESKGLRFRVVPTRAVVTSDPVILERIVANLVSNAIRYTHSGRVLLGCRRRGPGVRIEVWDSGVGIAAEHRDSVFQEFFQLDNPERDRSKGLGLGLSIVKRSASLLGHPLHVWSEVGKGSCFAIEVPRAPASVLPVQPAVDLSASPDLVSGSFIVVIDDEQDIRFAMESVLQRWGCHVVCAGSAEEAVDALQAHLRAPDLVISDYRLRDNQTGIDALMRIREALGEAVPAIIITGDSAAGDIRQVSQLGLPLAHKPVSAEHLRGLIADTLLRTRATTAGSAHQ